MIHHVPISPGLTVLDPTNHALIARELIRPGLIDRALISHGPLVHAPITPALRAPGPMGQGPMGQGQIDHVRIGHARTPPGLIDHALTDPGQTDLGRRGLRVMVRGAGPEKVSAVIAQVNAQGNALVSAGRLLAGQGLIVPAHHVTVPVTHGLAK